MDKLEFDAEKWADKEDYDFRTGPDGIPQTKF